MLILPPPPVEQNMKNIWDISLFLLYSTVYKIQALLVFVYDAGSYYNEFMRVNK